MYPTIYHALYDMFGIDWQWTKLLNSFGFFVAMAFVTASYFLSAELRRKAHQGLFEPQLKKIVIGESPNWMDIITSAFMGFLIGWKMLYLFLNGSELFSNGSNPQQEIFSLHGNIILGILLAIGFGVWRWWDYKRRQLTEPKEQEFLQYPHHITGNIVFATAIFGIIGAKLFHLLENPDELREFFAHPSFNSFVSGLTVYGGLILGSIGTLIYARIKKIELWPLCDAAAPSMILGYGIGRIGCQVSGDGDWGIANTAAKPEWLSWLPDWMWAYDYPNNVNYDASYQGHLGPLNDTFVEPITNPTLPCFDGYCTHLSPPVFPTPFYETIMAVIIFLILWRLRKRIQIPGFIFGLYLILNGIERFFIEKIRVNNKFDFFGMEGTQAELIAVIFMLVGIAILILQTKKQRALQQSSTNT
jgi:phosphatidylglycerol:prolipoprotein diacylglycerol transferase